MGGFMTNLGTIVTVIDFGEHGIKIVKKIKQFFADKPKNEKDTLFYAFFEKAAKELENEWDKLCQYGPDGKKLQTISSRSPVFWWGDWEALKEEMLQPGAGEEIYTHLDDLNSYFCRKLERRAEKNHEYPDESVKRGFKIMAAYLGNSIWVQALKNEDAYKILERKHYCSIGELEKSIQNYLNQILLELQKLTNELCNPSGKAEVERKAAWIPSRFFIPDYCRSYVEDVLAKMPKMTDGEENQMLRNNFMFIYGEHGMGKTVLAKLYARENFAGNTLFTEYKGSFKNTVESLYPLLYGREYDSDDRKNEKSAYHLVMEELRRNPEKTGRWLLVIDNFNNDGNEDDGEKYIREFQGSIFKELCSTGLRILITTTISAQIIKSYGMQIHPIERIEDLYKRISGKNVTDTAGKIIELVKKNTFIVTLIAGIVKKKPGILPELLKKLKELDVNSISLTTVDAGNRVQGKNTIFEHMKTVFQTAEIKGNKWKVMENAALLPLSGMDQDSFVEYLTNKSNDWSETEVIELLNELIEESWITKDEEKERKNNWISVHPIVREIICKDKNFTYEDCRVYCENLLARAKRDIKQDYYRCLAYSDELYENFRCFYKAVYKENESKVPFSIIDTGYVLTEIYEETGFYLDRIYELADEVQKCVTAWRPDEMTDRILRCRMISGSAYSKLHTETKDKTEKGRECESCKEGLLLAAAELRKCGATKSEDRYNKWLSRALIHGNTGAYYREISYLETGAERENSLRMAEREHRRGLKLRKALQAMYKDEDKAEELKGYIATSHHCIGRDLSDLGEQPEALAEHMEAETLRRSIINISSEKGQKTKWIQSCRMICNVLKELVLSGGREALENLERKIEFSDGSPGELYNRCLHSAKDYYEESGDPKEIERLRENFETMKEFFTEVKWEAGGI